MGAVPQPSPPSTEKQQQRVFYQSSAGLRHYFNRGLLYHRFGHFPEAIADFRQAIQLKPQIEDAHDSLAFALASRPGATQADGIEAVGLAMTACERTEWKDADTLDTLAAAAARAGDFVNAVKWEKQALAHNTIPEAKHAYQARLQLYQTRRAFTDTAPKPIPLGPSKGI